MTNQTYAAYENIPHEMRSYPQWVVWKLEKDASGKATKRPYNPLTHRLASVTNPQTWATFDQAMAAAAVPDMYSGIGFVLTEDDPYAFIDLDDTQGDVMALERQLEVYRRFESYAEHSPSGKGVHIIVKGKVPNGRRHSRMEVYSSQRYMTMTGNVYRNAPIQELHAELNALWEQMGDSTSQAVQELPDMPQTTSDDEIVRRASEAANGDKFAALYAGNWQSHYLSQSEADQALVNIIAFYTKNVEQVKRIFHASVLGKRDKAKRKDYLSGLLKKAFDRELAPIDFPKVPYTGKKSGATFAHVRPLRFAPISLDEWTSAQLAPETIVSNYLYADVGILVAPGGVGKTTLVLYEAICIVLGIELYGRTVRKQGKVLILTAEDSREQMVARLKCLATAMKLPEDMLKFVAENVLIEYVGGEDFRLCMVDSDVIASSPSTERVIESIKSLRPSLLVIDPAVSFGVGEGRVNDAEQGLIQAARRIRDAVGCGVRFIHHTGKQNARDGEIDQYAGRGGSAMADGSRMVAVLMRMTPDRWLKETGDTLAEDAEGLLLALPKLSYSAAQPHIYIERKGFAYRHVLTSIRGVEDKHAVIDGKVLEFLCAEEAKAVFHSKDSLEKSGMLPLPRNDIRGALARLELANRITFTPIIGRGKGQRIRVVNPPPA